MRKLLSVLVLFVLLHASGGAQSQFSQEQALSIDHHLSVDIGPRPMGSPAEQQALAYAVREFQLAHCDTAYVMHMARTEGTNTSSGIAVGILKGSSPRMIVIGGHIDSEGPEVPGTDDDGSGAASVIELAHVFGGSHPKNTLVFCCFGGEERGLRGSEYFVSRFPEIDSVDLMFQIDMANGTPVLDIDPSTHGADAPAWLVTATLEEFRDLGFDTPRFPTHAFSVNYALPAGAGSDHESFLHVGIPAIDFSSDVDRPIHTPRDNFENFLPDGLRRTGSVVEHLVRRFDGNVPPRQIEHYWLYLLGGIPIVVPFWGIWLFISVGVVLSVTALLVVRRRRLPAGDPGRVRWTTIKTIFFTLIIVCCGWFSGDLIGILRGLRHPWVSAIDEFIVYGAAAAAIGLWISARLSDQFRVSACPYVQFKRVFIILIVITALLGLINIKLLMEPGVALLFLSLAILIRNLIVRGIFLALSPWWMFRLIFSEWRSLFFRAFGTQLPDNFGTWIFFNSAVIILLTLFLLPFLFGALAVLDDSGMYEVFRRKIRSLQFLVVVGILFVISTGYLITIPTYNALWYKDLRIAERYDADAGRSSLEVRSSEYLTGLRVRYDEKDTTITAHTTSAVIGGQIPLDTGWAIVHDTDHQTETGGSVHHDLEVFVHTRIRPFRITLSLYGGRTPLRGLTTSAAYTVDRSLATLEWYAFPDSELTIPLSFDVTGKDSIRESVGVEFDTLVWPVRWDLDEAYALPRTVFTSSRWIRNR
ncbi:MAG TPA: M28 family metallopeptidase [Bacteroidota bacterium]|nr:M28 family metallopeptidase [Bacteroidota bacterium]